MKTGGNLTGSVRARARSMRVWARIAACVCGLALAALVSAWYWSANQGLRAEPIRLQAAFAAGEPAGTADYRIMPPIESGSLLLFPVVRENGKSPGGAGFLTLDEGLKSGAVEVTEAGRVRGLVRRRDHDAPWWNGGDQVNNLVLVNNSGKPLLLLAGEIVTGGKQDRVIAKDRIVPAGGDPIDLGVFCIEPGRWTESSLMFGASAKMPAESIMVQPAVREQAMVAKSQQEVWNSVHGTLLDMAAAGSPRGTQVLDSRPLQTTSYAKAVQSDELRSKVDEAAAPIMQSRDAILAELRKQGAVGVVVAVRGEIVWADVFANTDLLARYWTKLVRSYAAETLSQGETHGAPSVADAERFLENPVNGTETSEGSVGVYRYREMKAGGTETFVLESLLPESRGDVHLSKLKVRTRSNGLQKWHGGALPDFMPPHPLLNVPDQLKPE